MEGATIRGLSTTGAPLISMENADLSVTDSAMTGNEHSSGSGSEPWISLSEASAATFSNADFSGNTDADFKMSNGVNSSFTGSTFSDNVHTGSDAKMFDIEPSGNTVAFEGAEFSGNDGLKWIVLSLDWDADIVVSNSEFKNNGGVDYDIGSEDADRFLPLDGDMTWNEGHAACLDEGTTLATIADDSDATALWTMAQESGSDLFVGLNDLDEEGTWEWTSGHICDSNTLTVSMDSCAALAYWLDGQPNDHGDGQDCGAVRYRADNLTSLLNDEDCDTETNPVVCDWLPPDGGSANITIVSSVLSSGVDAADGVATIINSVFHISTTTTDAAGGGDADSGSSDSSDSDSGSSEKSYRGLKNDQVMDLSS